MPVTARSGARADAPASGEARSHVNLGPGPEAELTWLVHRAAQRLHALVGAQAGVHGLTLRDHIVLSALHKTRDLTQVELGQALGMDKTTLTAEIDRLERAGLVSRRVDPRDRRARIPELTADGDAVRARIATGAQEAEIAAVAHLTAGQVQELRETLHRIIGTADDPGTCL